MPSQDTRHVPLVGRTLPGSLLPRTTVVETPLHQRSADAEPLRGSFCVSLLPCHFERCSPRYEKLAGQPVGLEFHGRVPAAAASVDDLGRGLMTKENVADLVDDVARLSNSGVRGVRDDHAHAIALEERGRELAPPAPKPFSAAALRGQTQFDTLGCAKCHLPTITSLRGPLAAYTDLLLHDMGVGIADNIAAGVPQSSSIDGPTTYREFRTAPLWGVSMSGPWLHDGRAQTLEEAILAHGGEAQTARDAFANLPQADRADVLAFLESL